MATSGRRRDPSAGSDEVAFDATRCVEEPLDAPARLLDALHPADLVGLFRAQPRDDDETPPDCGDAPLDAIVVELGARVFSTTNKTTTTTTTTERARACALRTASAAELFARASQRVHAAAIVFADDEPSIAPWLTSAARAGWTLERSLCDPSAACGYLLRRADPENPISALARYHAPDGSCEEIATLERYGMVQDLRVVRSSPRN